MKTSDGGRSWHPQLVSRDQITALASGGRVDYALADTARCTRRRRRRHRLGLDAVDQRPPAGAEAAGPRARLRTALTGRRRRGDRRLDLPERDDGSTSWRPRRRTGRSSPAGRSARRRASSPRSWVMPITAGPGRGLRSAWVTKRRPPKGPGGHPLRPGPRRLRWRRQPAAGGTLPAPVRDGRRQRHAGLVLGRRRQLRGRRRGRFRAAMVEEGAAIVDIGGESTRPGLRGRLAGRGAAPRRSRARGAQGASRSRSTRRRPRSPGARSSSAQSS